MQMGTIQEKYKEGWQRLTRRRIKFLNETEQNLSEGIDKIFREV